MAYFAYEELKWAGPDLNRRPLARKAPRFPATNEEETGQLLKSFYDFQTIDLKRNKRFKKR